MNDALQHYGVKGMKWGVRRFTNKNGTLTSAGRLRYGKASSNGSLRRKRLESARDSAYRDSENLRKAGYITESKAVRKVGDKHQAKLDRLDNRGELTPEQQRRRTIAKRVAIGAGVTAAAVLGTYGAYKLANSPQAKKYVSRGQAVVNSSKNNMRATMSQAKMSVDNARIGASIAGNKARRAADAGFDRAGQAVSRTGAAIKNAPANAYARAAVGEAQARRAVDNARIGASIAGNQARRTADAGLDRARQIGSRAQDVAGNARIGASIAGNQARRAASNASEAVRRTASRGAAAARNAGANAYGRAAVGEAQARRAVGNARIGASIAGNQARRAASNASEAVRRTASRGAAAARNAGNNAYARAAVGEAQARRAVGNARVGASIAGNQARRAYDDLVDRGARVVSSRSNRSRDISGGNSADQIRYAADLVKKAKRRKRG